MMAPVNLSSGSGLKAASVEHPFPEFHVIVIEGTESPEVMGVDIVGYQFALIDEPAGIAITGTRYIVGGIQWARPKPK